MSELLRRRRSTPATINPTRQTVEGRTSTFSGTHGSGLTPTASRPPAIEPPPEPRAPTGAHTVGPPDISGNQLMWEALIDHRASAAQLRDAHDRLIARLSNMETPAQIQPAIINPNNQGSYTTELAEEVAMPTLSVGVLNPNGIPVYWSPIGSAAASQRSYSTPPNALLVLPISIQHLELGCAQTDLGANTAVAFVIRFFTVQPAFLGRGA